jgi:hypothetical protein
MLPRSHTSNLQERDISSPFEVPLELEQHQQQSPEAFEDRRLSTTHLLCLPRTHSSHFQERAFRNSHFEDALLHSSNFEDSMSSHPEEDPLEHDSGLEELIGELRTDIFVDDFDDGSCGVPESRPLLDNVYSLYRESRFSNTLNDSMGGGELSSSEERLKGQMEKFELLKAEMTKAANRQADMRKQKPSCFNENEEERRLQELKKKIEIELRQDEHEVIEQVDWEEDDGDSSAEGVRDNDGCDEPGFAEEKRKDGQGQGIKDAENNEETREDAHALANDVDLARIQTHDIEVIHVEDGEWTESDLSDSGLSDSGDCASDYSISSSIVSENEMHSENGDWLSGGFGLDTIALMNEEQSDYCEDDGLSFDSFDLPENTVSFDFREFRAGSNISLLEAIVSDVRAFMTEPLAAEEEDELEWQEGRDIKSLNRDYELETKHMSMTTANTESTGCSSKAVAESSLVDSFLHDEGTIATHLSMTLLPQILEANGNDGWKPPEVEDVLDDDDDIELLSEEVNLDKHEATLSRRKRLLLRIRRGLLMCSQHS